MITLAAMFRHPVRLAVPQRSGIAFSARTAAASAAQGSKGRSQVARRMCLGGGRAGLHRSRLVRSRGRETRG